MLPGPEVDLVSLPVAKGEPLRRELEAFLDCVRTRRAPLVTGEQARDALAVSLNILATIEEHAQTVARTLALR